MDGGRRGEREKDENDEKEEGDDAPSSASLSFALKQQPKAVWIDVGSAPRATVDAHAAPRHLTLTNSEPRGLGLASHDSPPLCPCHTQKENTSLPLPSVPASLRPSLPLLNLLTRPR